MSAAQKAALAVVAKSMGWPQVVKMLFTILSRPGAQGSGRIIIKTSATPASFNYPLCGDNTDE